MMLHLCLDQGGHASRALVLDERGDVVTRALREVKTQFPDVDRVEQDANEVVESVRDAAEAALADLSARVAEVRSVGLATQRSSIVCWDRRTGAALSPVISWQDRRARAWLSQFAGRAADIESRTGLRLSPHYGASKLRWCLDHLQPVRAAEAAGRLAFGPLASFLAYRLLDEQPLRVDPSNAQRTLLWNLARRDWDPELLALFGVPRRALPACSATRATYGHVIVGEHRFALDVVIGDQAAALFAFGEPQADTAYVNLGTGAFVQRTLHQPARADGLLTGIAAERGDTVTYTLEGTVNGAGAALAWAARTLELPELNAQLPDWLLRDAEPPLFLNGIGGLGAPYWVADFSSRFVGAGEPWQRAIAVVESIVFLIAVNLERMQQHGALQSLIVTGGLAPLDGLCQRLADISALRAQRPREHEATARGLAWLLAGHDVTAAATSWPVTDAADFSPRPNPALHERYRRWRAAMEAACVDVSEPHR